MYIRPLSSVCVHDHYPVCVYMATIQGVCTWPLSRVCVHGHYPECVYMATIQSVCTWPLSRVCVHGHYPECVYMTTIYVECASAHKPCCKHQWSTPILGPMFYIRIVLQEQAYDLVVPLPACRSERNVIVTPRRYVDSSSSVQQ